MTTIELHVGYRGIPHLANNERDAPNFLHAALNTITCAPFVEERRLEFYISGSCESADDTLPYLKQPAASCASPGLLVRGSGFSNPRERSGIAIQGFSPGGGASHSNPRDADDQANSSGLSLKPALTGFSQMYVGSFL